MSPRRGTAAITRTAAPMLPNLATIVIIFHSPLMVLVISAVFAVFAAMIPVLLAFVAEILHPVHMEMELEQVKLDFRAWPDVFRHRRSHVWRSIWWTPIRHGVRRHRFRWHWVRRHPVWRHLIGWHPVWRHWVCWHAIRRHWICRHAIRRHRVGRHWFGWHRIRRLRHHLVGRWCSRPLRLRHRAGRDVVLRIFRAFWHIRLRWRWYVR